MDCMTLNDLAVGQSAVITAVGGSGALRQHFLDLGLIPGVAVKVLKYAPLGDPMEIAVHNYVLTLRRADAATVAVDTALPAEPAAIAVAVKERVSEIEHPGIGEGGRYHDPAGAKPLPPGTLLRFALAGNQNSGKTTLFNALTGSDQHVGNFPGVTVDRKDGSIRGLAIPTQVTDLPGVYSLSPYSGEEIVTRDHILREKPHAIINIVDASNIERNLYLTLQLLSLDLPMVIALNMMDEVRANSGTVYINELENALGVPVIPISAKKNEGIDELIDHAVHVAQNQERPEPRDFFAADGSGAVGRCLNAVCHLIEDHAARAGLPEQFAGLRVMSGDPDIIEWLALDQNEIEAIEHIAVQLEAERGLDRAAALADVRFRFIRALAAATVVHPAETKERALTRRADDFLVGRWTALPAFIIIMYAMFQLTFEIIGPFLQDIVRAGVDAVTAAADGWLASLGVNDVIHALVIDAAFSGVGSVLSFIPIVVTLFFFLSLLEDSGYMARVAFVMDKLLRKIGLSGRSIVPMLMGFGCTVPGIMAARTLPSERDRKMTILLTPFMSCSAKLPIYAFFTAALFPTNGGTVISLLYFGGIGVAVLVALALKNTVFKGEAVPFVMELPNYRPPTVKNLRRLVWVKASDFFRRAFTVILAATIVIWFLRSFDLRLNIATDTADSILAAVSGTLAPLFAPLGMGDWRVVTALITGIMAKESVVATLAMLIPNEAALRALLTVPNAAALLTFCLLYTPCVAAIAVVRREMGTKWAAFVVAFQCAVAWVAAWLVRTAVLLWR